jgi:hypothetical protein
MATVSAWGCCGSEVKTLPLTIKISASGIDFLHQELTI